MKSVKFWFLMFGSIIVCALYLEQIYLSRSIYHQQRILIEAQQFVALTPNYENSWKQLATRIYQASHQDDALADVLKRNQISVQVGKPASSVAPAPQPAPTSAPVPESPTSKIRTPVGP